MKSSRISIRIGGVLAVGAAITLPPLAAANAQAPKRVGDARRDGRHRASAA